MTQHRPLAGRTLTLNYGATSRRRTSSLAHQMAMLVGSADDR